MGDKPSRDQQLRGMRPEPAEDRTVFRLTGNFSEDLARTYKHVTGKDLPEQDPEQVPEGWLKIEPHLRTADGMMLARDCDGVAWTIRQVTSYGNA